LRVSDTASTAVAVVAALAAGSAFAIGSVLQQRAARAAPDEESLSPRLVARLLHRRDWLLGVAADAGSFGLQALALAFGPLSLVQPLIVCELLFAVPIAVRLRHRRLGAPEWAGTLMVAVGLLGFVVAAAPHGGDPGPGMPVWIGVLAGVAVVVAGSVTLGRLARGPARATLYALAGAAMFGLLAALTKTSTHYLGQGGVAFFTAWQPYAMAAVAVVGMVVQQSAYQAGPLPASLPVMNAGEPAVAALIGVFAFHEHVAHTPLRLAASLAGVVVLVAGIVVLDRSPVVLDLQTRGAADERQDEQESGRRASKVAV
jgi:drug/metabolite transporter (DMT)-like permease